MLAFFSQATYDILFKDKLAAFPLLRQRSRLTLAHYVNVTFDPLTYVFGEDPPDTSSVSSPAGTKDTEPESRSVSRYSRYFLVLILCHQGKKRNRAVDKKGISKARRRKKKIAKEEL